MACQTIVASVVEQNFDVIVNDNDVTVTISLVAGTLGAAGAGSGDVIGPTTNTDQYVPQWDGTDTKTLQNGFPISTFGKSLVIASTSANARSILSITALCTFIIDGNGSVPSTGAYNLSTVPRGTVLTSYSLTGDKIGSAVIDVKIGGTSIVGAGNKPTLVNTNTVQAVLSGWTTTTLTANQIMTFNLDSIATCTFLELQLRGTI
jgi:hypothetical protein